MPETSNQSMRAIRVQGMKERVQTFLLKERNVGKGTGFGTRNKTRFLVKNANKDEIIVLLLYKGW